MMLAWKTVAHFGSNALPNVGGGMTSNIYYEVVDNIILASLLGYQAHPDLASHHFSFYTELQILLFFGLPVPLYMPLLYLEHPCYVSGSKGLVLYQKIHFR